MTQTKNHYAYPIGKEKILRITHNESPAHVGALKYAVDFIVPEGTPVMVVADGKIVEIKDDSDIGGKDKKYEPHGNYIEIQHSNGEYSEYEHLQKGSAIIKVGEVVKQGQIIGYSGATGWIAHLGPHLHFMVGKYGKTVEEYETLEIQWKD
ncbi:MAG: M23 family metallopeptidase [Nanoarchaeota archaeon]